MNSPIFCAIDTGDRKKAFQICDAIKDQVAGFKLGMEFFFAHGPEGVREMAATFGRDIFLDLKLHDIPNTAMGGINSIGIRPAEGAPGPGL